MSPDMKSKKIEYEIYNTILEIKFRKHGYKTWKMEILLIYKEKWDRIWGIELFMKDENCYNQNMCKRQNLLGYALIKVRKQLYI